MLLNIYGEPLDGIIYHATSQTSKVYKPSKKKNDFLPRYILTWNNNVSIISW